MSFKSVVEKVLIAKQLAIEPIPADDLNAGEEFIEDGRRHHEAFADDRGLRKSVVPQHFIPEYGRVRLLYKSPAPSVGAQRIQPLQKSEPLDDDITDREIIVAGYASPQVIDRERHLIEKEAMARDLPRFLAKPEFANAMILHSNVQVGQVLPEWTHPETGQVYKTQVDDIGLFCVIKIRTDKYRPKICDKVVEDIMQGSLKAFSISGDAPVASRQYRCADGQCFWVIPEIEFYEITICEEGINQDAKLMILNKGCPDGMCGLVRKDAPETPSELVAEHERVIEVLEEGTPSERKEEAERQKEELKEYKEKEEEIRERVEEIAEKVGEEVAARMLNDAADAARKLNQAEPPAAAPVKKDGVVGVGLGSGGAGDATTMQDFAQPYTPETATKMDTDVGQMLAEYEEKINAGGSPEQVYFEMLETAPPWFGTRSNTFRTFLLEAYRRKLPIPTVRLRLYGRNETEGVVADPHFTAWDLLATALPRGALRKDVSAVPHKHSPYGTKENLPGMVDERGLRNTVPGAGHREDEEPEESELYYLNLAVSSLSGGPLTKHIGPNIKPHWHGRKNRPAVHTGRRRGTPTAEGSTTRSDYGPPFYVGQAVEVSNPDHPLYGQRGRVVKVRDAKIVVSVHGARTSFSPVDLRPLSPTRKINNYAVPVEVGVQRMKIVSGGRESPMEIVREQVARAKFLGTVMNCWIGKAGRRGVAERLAGRDFMQDPKQQVEPENVAVQAGVRKAPPAVGTPAHRSTRHHTSPSAQPVGGRKASYTGNIGEPKGRRVQAAATTEIHATGDVAPLGGRKISTEPVWQNPPTHGIADQQLVNPPAQGVQGVGTKPKYVVHHGDPYARRSKPALPRSENAGAAQDPRTHVDPRGAPRK